MLGCACVVDGDCRLLTPGVAVQLRSVPSPAFSEELRKNCRERLLACLADLTGQSTLIKGGYTSFWCHCWEGHGR